MFRYNILIVLSVLIAVRCSTQKDNVYQQLSARFVANEPSGKTIAVFMYRPWGCVGCNLTVNDIIKDDIFSMSVAQKVIFIQKNIRNVELTEFTNSLPAVEGKQLIVCNDGALFDKLDNLSLGDKFDGKPRLLLIKPGEDSIEWVGLREPTMHQHIHSILSK